MKSLNATRCIVKKIFQNIIIGLVIAAIIASLYSILSGEASLSIDILSNHNQEAKGRTFEVAVLILLALLLGTLTNLYRKARYRKSSKWEEWFIEEFKKTKAKKSEGEQDN